MSKVIVKNKFAKSDYEIASTYICGISLLGWEVKSIRAGNVKLTNAFCSISNKNELWLNNANVSQYMLIKCEPYRSRKLLMHKKEILRLKNELDRNALTLIPLSIFWSKNKIKVEIASVKHLKKYDKRQKIKKEEQNKIIKKIIY
ncbi:SsrA-binding protein SmpB [Metamycoplasma hyosynoviae]|uniref:SsrA-binding protein SmpB n=1 Tax=Metamycoplasma hyosynoviae TaxID=29559 RepID=UPI002360138A|nr:SsrA-binding protein SmpB [Metamycoplasma hyosynoviae]MDD1366133.1 SsrA-binding protein SmpB [Metamycoplasma hyosynoviae]